MSTSLVDVTHPAPSTRPCCALAARPRIGGSGRVGLLAQLRRRDAETVRREAAALRQRLAELTTALKLPDPPRAGG